MGEVRENITLVNVGDIINVGRGYIKQEEIRHVTVEALVDTGAMNLVIGEETRKRLGLAIAQENTARLAGGVTQTCNVTEPVTIRWKDRFSSCHALVLPGSEEILLGCIPLEDMDLKVNPGRGCLEGAHGDMWVRYIRKLTLNKRI